MTRTFFPLVITWADLQFVGRKYRRWLAGAAIGSAMAALLLAFVSPVGHTAKALFREGSPPQLPSSALPNLFLSSIASMSPDGSGIVYMQSEQVLRRVIDTLGLQVTVNKRSMAPTVLQNIYSNSQIYLGRTLPEQEHFSFTDVHYSGLQPIHFLLTFSDADHFSLRNNKGQMVANGVLGKKVTMPDVAFTLMEAPSDVKTGEKYDVLISPWENALADIRKRLEIRPEKLDKALLKLYYTHSSRAQAARIVDGIMDAYLRYLQEENDRIADKQLAFLDKRQGQFTAKYDQELDEHLTCLKQNIETLGFIQVGQELEFLAVPQHELKNKLVTLDNLFDRLKRVQASYALASKASSESEEGAYHITAAAAHPSAMKRGDVRAEQFAGIDLETAQRLHNDYQRELDVYQEKIDTLSFLLARVHRQDFDLDALSSVGVDGVTADLIKGASELVLQSKDLNNRSPKDLQRIEESLATQKAFIAEHMNQALELYKQNAQIAQHKLARLRDTMMSLIKTEKAVIYKQLHELQSQLSELPARWKMEQQLEMKREMLGKIVEGIAQMIEGKTIECRLKQLNSKVIDRAHCDLLPKKRPFLFLLSLCMCAGVGLTYFFFFCRMLLRGFPLNESSARALELATSGTLGSFCDAPLQKLSRNDTDVLRALANFIQNKKKVGSGVVVALAGSSRLNFLPNLARLLKLRGAKVLLVDAAFDCTESRVETDTLCDYLSEKSATWVPQKNEGFDRLPCGTAGAFCAELLHNDRFEQFLDKARKEYDVVLFVCSGVFDANAVNCAVQKADGFIISMQEETLEQLERMGCIEKLKCSDTSTIVFQEGLAYGKNSDRDHFWWKVRRA